MGEGEFNCTIRKMKRKQTACINELEPYDMTIYKFATFSIHLREYLIENWQRLNLSYCTTGLTAVPRKRKCKELQYLQACCRVDG